MIAPATCIEIVKTPVEFRALADEWHALWRRAKGRHHESFAACWLSWECVAKPIGRSLRIIAARCDGRLVAVWPLVRSLNRLWTILRPLSSESADYTTLLVDPEHASVSLIESIWRAALERCRSDIFVLPYLDHGDELFRLARSHEGLIESSQIPYAIARLSHEKSWESFAASLGTLSGKKPGALLRRLERHGTVEMRILGPEDADQNACMIDWMLTCKRKWAEGKNNQGAWLFSQRFRDYLVALANHPADSDGRPCARLLVLSLDGVPIAANMVGLGTEMMLGMMAGFDHEYGKLAPGAITTEAWVRWAIENRLDFDLGVGSESFKPYWTKGNMAVASSIRIAQSRWGRVAFAIHDCINTLPVARAAIRRSSVDVAAEKR
jgi:CelD/BcsL family acetyltransferase involved in cellulose biosynthesis